MKSEYDRSRSDRSRPHVRAAGIISSEHGVTHDLVVHERLFPTSASSLNIAYSPCGEELKEIKQTAPNHGERKMNSRYAHDDRQGRQGYRLESWCSLVKLSLSIHVATLMHPYVISCSDKRNKSTQANSFTSRPRDITL